MVHTSKRLGQDVKFSLLRAKISQDVDKLLTFQKFFFPCVAWFSTILVLTPTNLCHYFVSTSNTLLIYIV
jgi:hypothetical protein